MIDIERIRKLADALRKEAGHEDKEFPEPDDYCPHAGGDFSRSCAEALDAILADNEQLRAALTQIKTVCTDNAAETVRHDLALIFVGSIARAALEP